MDTEWLQRVSSVTIREVQQAEAFGQSQQVIRITGGEELSWGAASSQLTRNVRLALEQVFTALKTPGFNQILTDEAPLDNDNDRAQRFLVSIDISRPELLSSIMKEVTTVANDLVKRGIISGWHPQLSTPIYRIDQRRVTFSLIVLPAEDDGSTSASENATLTSGPGNGSTSAERLRSILANFSQLSPTNTVIYSEQPRGNQHSSDIHTFTYDHNQTPEEQTSTEETACYSEPEPITFTTRIFQWASALSLLHRESNPYSGVGKSPEQKTEECRWLPSFLRSSDTDSEERQDTQRSRREVFVLHTWIVDSEEGLNSLEVMMGRVIAYLARGRHAYNLRLARIDDLGNGQAQVSFELFNYIPSSDLAAGHSIASLSINPVSLNSAVGDASFRAQRWRPISTILSENAQARPGVATRVLRRIRGGQASTNQSSTDNESLLRVQMLRLQLGTEGE